MKRRDFLKRLATVLAVLPFASCIFRTHPMIYAALDPGVGNSEGIIAYRRGFYFVRLDDYDAPRFEVVNGEWTHVNPWRRK